MQIRVEELQRQNEARTYERPVLRGTAEPGNSWEDYSAAGVAAFKVRPVYNIQDYVRGNYPKDPFSKAAAAAGPCLEAFDRFRRGARRAESRPMLNYYHVMNPKLTGDQGLRVLPWVGMLQARTLLQEGQPAEAVDVWLDLFQFGRDFMDGTNHDSITISLDFLEYVMFETRTGLIGGKLPIESLRTLDRGLDILSRSWPTGERNRENHLLALGLGLKAEADENTIIYQGRKPRTTSSWRWLFSNRLRAARTFNFCDKLATEVFPKDRDAARAVVWEWWDPVVEDTIQGVFNETSGLPTRLRMLRIAARFAATGEVLDLPSGTDRPFLIAREGPALRVALPDPRVPDDGSNNNWWYGGKPFVIRVVRSP